MPSSRSNRSTSLGKGKKYDFAKLNNNKCAEFYNTKTDFDPKKSNKGKSFGMSRSYYEKVYCDSNIKHERNVPGPGQYEAHNKFGRENPRYTLGGRLKEKSGEAGKFPGPGEYEYLHINPPGKFISSTYHNATNIIWGNSKEKRFNYSCKEIIFYFILFLIKI
jgi:hypothetical protein